MKTKFYTFWIIVTSIISSCIGPPIPINTLEIEDGNKICLELKANIVIGSKTFTLSNKGLRGVDYDSYLDGDGLHWTYDAECLLSNQTSKRVSGKADLDGDDLLRQIVISPKADGTPTARIAGGATSPAIIF